MVQKEMKRNKIDSYAKIIHYVLERNLSKYVIVKFCKHANWNKYEIRNENLMYSRLADF